MKKELPHFYINNSYGGNQQWFSELSMRLGGCAAETACDICIYLSLYKEADLYPHDIKSLNKADYIRFATQMKPFLHPRMGGIDKLSTYVNGFTEYASSIGKNVSISCVEGFQSFETALQTLVEQINGGVPAAFLCLKHKNKSFRDYKWHWFLINGYDISENRALVKAVTYSSFEWLDFEKLWNSGYERKGGMVIIEAQ